MDFKFDKNKDFRVGVIKTYGKSMKLDDDVININNMSSFRTGKVKPYIPYLYYTILLIVSLISLALLPLGLTLLAIFFYLIYKKYRQFVDPNFYLFIFMNDSTSFRIHVGNIELLNKISNTLIDIINDKGGNYTFNIDKSVMTSNDNHVEHHINSHNSNHVENNDSHDVSMNGSVTGSNNQFGTGNYSSNNYSKMLIDEIKKAKPMFNDTSDEKIALNELNNAAKTNNESVIKAVLKKFPDVFNKNFISNTFSSVVSGILLNLIN